MYHRVRTTLFRHYIGYQERCAFLLCLGLIACSFSPLSPKNLTITSEPHVQVEEEVSLENLSKEGTLIVSEILFTPDKAPVRWNGPGPFEVAPGQTSDIRVRFLPEEEGFWEETLIFKTNAGDFLVPITLTAEIGTDLDGDGWSVQMGDCDDSESLVHPDAIEICNQRDDDCDGDEDEDFDNDFDGYLDQAQCNHGLDCDDNDKTANPGVEEECDQTDSDCNGFKDDITILADLQVGVCMGSTKECPNFGGAREPDYTELPFYEVREVSCDGLDNDCDGQIDVFDYLKDGTPDCVDDDKDGQSEVEGDCDDLDPNINAVHCGPKEIGVTSLSDGFTTLDLNIWKNQSYSIEGGTYHGVALNKDELYFATRIYKTFLHVYLRPYASEVEIAYGPETMAVLPNAANDGLHFLLKNGLLVNYSLTGPETANIPMLGDTRAMVRDNEFLWICSSDGYLHRLNPVSETLDTLDTETGCYGPPIVDTQNNQIIVLGYEDYLLTAIDRTTLSIKTQLATDYRVLRGVIIDDKLWVSTGVDKSIEIRNASTLAFEAEMSMDTPVQGLWYDSVRKHLWVALFEDDKIISIQVETGTILRTLPVVEPVDFFPLVP